MLKNRQKYLIIQEVLNIFINKQNKKKHDTDSYIMYGYMVRHRHHLILIKCNDDRMMLINKIFYMNRNTCLVIFLS